MSLKFKKWMGVVEGLLPSHLVQGDHPIREKGMGTLVEHPSCTRALSTHYVLGPELSYLHSVSWGSSSALPTAPCKALHPA